MKHTWCDVTSLRSWLRIRELSKHTNNSIKNKTTPKSSTFMKILNSNLSNTNVRAKHQVRPPANVWPIMHSFDNHHFELSKNCVEFQWNPDSELYFKPHISRCTIEFAQEKNFFVFVWDLCHTKKTTRHVSTVEKSKQYVKIMSIH